VNAPNRQDPQKKRMGYGRQYLDEEDVEAVVRALKSDWLTQGSTIGEFENGLAQMFSARYSCAVSSGTAALHLSGLALGWGRNDVVITTPISFLASANCVRFCGAEVDFADINRKTYTIDASLLEKKLERCRREGKNPKAIVGVDYAGHPCDWQELKALADRYRLQLGCENAQ